MTGAPIPPGCDAVVMHERTRTRRWTSCRFEPAIRAGQNLLPRGREMRAGEVVVARGSILEPARLGVLASVGRIDGRGRAAAAVAIVPTGDELVEPGPDAGPGSDPQLERRDAPCPGDPGGRDARSAADRAGRAGAAGRRSSSAGSRPMCWSSPAASRPASAISFRRHLDALGVRVRLPQGAPQAGQAALVRGRTAAGRPARGPRLRAARQSRERTGGFPLVRQAGPGGPGRQAGSRAPAGFACGSRAASPIAAIAPPIFPSGWSTRRADAAGLPSIETLDWRLGRSAHRRRGRRLRRLSPPAIAITLQVKLSASCP